MKNTQEIYVSFQKMFLPIDQIAHDQIKLNACIREIHRNVTLREEKQQAVPETEKGITSRRSRTEGITIKRCRSCGI